MRKYLIYLLSSGAALASFIAVLAVHGGWEAVAAGSTILASAAALASLIALVAGRERPPRAWHA